MGWTQPLCEGCWQKENPGRDPVRMISTDKERCCQCGRDTFSGIYTRVDPKTVPYPTDD